MKTNPSLVPLHLQFQATFAEGADLLIPAHSHRGRLGRALRVGMCVIAITLFP